MSRKIFFCANCTIRPPLSPLCNLHKTFVRQQDQVFVHFAQKIAQKSAKFCAIFLLFLTEMDIFVQNDEILPDFWLFFVHFDGVEKSGGFLCNLHNDFCTKKFGSLCKLHKNGSPPGWWTTFAIHSIKLSIGGR